MFANFKTAASLLYYATVLDPSPPLVPFHFSHGIEEGEFAPRWRDGSVTSLNEVGMEEVVARETRKWRVVEDR